LLYGAYLRPIKQGEAHAITNESPGQDSGTELVANLGRSLDEGLLLGQALPLAGQQPPPHCVGEPGEPSTEVREIAIGIREDSPLGDAQESCLRHEKPIHHRQLALAEVPPEFPIKPRRQGRDDHVWLKASAVPADGEEPSAVGLRKRGQNPRTHPVEVRRLDKQLTSRAPVVIGGSLGVISKNIGARPEEGGSMRSPHRRGHHLLVEAAAQLETRHRTTHASHYRIAGSAADSPLGPSHRRNGHRDARTVMEATTSTEH